MKKVTFGTCCITMSIRVPVKRIFKKYDIERKPKDAIYEYVLRKSKLKRLEKTDQIYFFEQDGELDDTFEEDEVKE